MHEASQSITLPSTAEYSNTPLPTLAKKCRAKLRPTNNSWRVDETYVKVKVKGEWMYLYLYRAVDSDGNTVEFMLSPTRDAVSAKRFFRKALRSRHTFPSRVINVDRNPSYPKAVDKLKKKGTLPEECQLRPIKYLNNLNLIEQDHRSIKRRVNPGMGFWSFDTAWRSHDVANTPGLRSDAPAKEGSGKGHKQGRHQEPDPVRISSLRAGCLGFEPFLYKL